MRAPVVGVLHPGQMGAAVAAQAMRGGARVLWCPAGRGEATARRAAEAGLEPIADLAGLLDRSAVVLSICPPAAAESLARAVADHGFGGVFVEANAVSPARVERIAAAVGASGAQLVDGAVIGPPPRAGVGARLYLSGPRDRADAVAALFAGTAVEAVVLDSGQGAASTLKMAFASYQKATRTLAAVAHALAARERLGDHLLVEARRMAGLPLAETDYLPSVAARAWRWAPELVEVGDTLAAHGLPDELARATAAVLQRWDPDRDRWDIDVPDVLDGLRRPRGAG